MKLLFDFFPIFLFFIGYKFFGIYAATAIAMIASLLQVLLYRMKHQRYERMHVISLLLILVLGGATLFFHNPWFIKWKPTGLYWLSAVAFIASHFIGKKPLIQRMMDGNVQLPSKIWHRLNAAWAIYFMVMGGLNIFVAYHFNTDVWVDFKLIGGVGLMLVFVFLQAMYLTRHAIEEPSAKDSR